MREELWTFVCNNVCMLLQHFFFTLAPRVQMWKWMFLRMNNNNKKYMERNISVQCSMQKWYIYKRPNQYHFFFQKKNASWFFPFFCKWMNISNKYSCMLINFASFFLSSAYIYLFREVWYLINYIIICIVR